MAFPADHTGLVQLDVNKLLVVGTHNGFAALITEQSLGIKKAFAFTNTDNGGGDIRFSTDVAGLNRIPLEVVSWDTTAETGQLWLIFDGVSSITDAVVYLWGDNTGDTQPPVTDTYGRNSVWPDDLFNHHLDSITSTVNSSGDANWDINVVNSGVSNSTNSPYGGTSINFDGTSNAVAEISTNVAIASNTSEPLTFIAWVRPTNIPDDEMGIFLRDTGVYRENFRVFSDDFNTVTTNTDTYLIQTDDIYTRQGDTGNNSMSLDVWQMLTFITEESIQRASYLDGVMVSNITGASVTGLDVGANAGWLFGGTSNFVSSNWQGQMADVRVVKSRLDGEYITSMHNNQRFSGSFWIASDFPSMQPIILNPDTVTHTTSAIDPVVNLASEIQLTPDTVIYQTRSVDPTVVLSFGLQLNPETTRFITRSIDPQVEVGAPLLICSHTIDYADSLITVKFGDTQVKVEYCPK